MNNKPGNLGRGLGELFNEAAYARTTIPSFEEGFAKVPAGQIDLPDWMGMRNRNGAALDDLAESIREHGILQPLLVEQNQSRYTIVSGARRYAAALRAGIQSIPVIIIPGKENDLLGIYLAENIQQLCFNFDDHAPELTALCEHFAITASDLRDRIQRLAPHTLQQALEEQAEAALVPDLPPPNESAEEKLPTSPPPLPGESSHPPTEEIPSEFESTDEPATDRFKPWFYASTAALIISIVVAVIAFGTRRVQTIEVEKTVFVDVPRSIIVKDTSPTVPTKGKDPVLSSEFQKGKQPGTPIPSKKLSPPAPLAPTLPTPLLSALQISGLTVAGSAQQLNLTFEQPVFSYRSEINTEAKALLQQIATALLPYASQITVQISGHTDDDPITSSAYFSNYDLGLQRAVAVAEYLHRAGMLPVAQLMARSDGELRAPFSNAQATTKRKNRTVTIQLLPH